jgi:hypothetical protein
VWPFQWRIAVSTLSGYFIYQAYNPILFASHGPEAAGRMGMSSTIMAAISGTAMAWVSTKSAPFGAMIARREFARLDAEFFRALKQSLVAIVGAAACFWAGVLALDALGWSVASRILDPMPLALLILTAIVNHVVTCEAIYLRAHKREPFLGLAVALAVGVLGTSYWLAPAHGALGMTAGSLVVTIIIGLFGGTWVFIAKRREWHGDLGTEGGAS